MTIEQLQCILQTKGYLPHIDPDGDFSFKAQGRHMYASVDGGDPDYICIFLDFLVSSENCNSEFYALKAANKTERIFKCVKCMLLNVDGCEFHFRVAVECLTDAKVLVHNICRYIDIICSATHCLEDKLSD